MNDLPELSGPVGSRLRQAREAQELTLQFVSERLKFSVRQVEALEAGQFLHFPHRTQLRGFVRAYARLLQLPDTELMRMLDAELPVDEPRPERPQLKGAVLYKPNTARWSLLMTLMLAVMLASAGGGWLLYGWLQKSHLTQRPVPENQLLLESDLVLPLPASEPVASAATASAEQASTPAASGLVLNFAEASWVEVLDATGNSRFRAIGQPRQQVAVSGRPPLRITVGKVDAVKISFAGQPVDLKPHTRGEVARLTLPPAR